ncbi:alpha/beta hydrolase family protein [Streptomyces sp. NPDC057654]|uniref:S9 family peptidase n=1 Tax=Streptomyces sp. NPDC057654 TaxID=3346196 RepID=UPI0036C6ACD0
MSAPGPLTSRVLHTPIETATASAGDGYGWGMHRHLYPPAVPESDDAPADLRTGQAEFCSPDGRSWAPRELHDVVGRPVRNAGRWAGIAVADGEPRGWIADTATRRVRLLDTVVGLTAGDGAPVAWSGSEVVMPVAAPARLRAPHYVFEAEPGQRIRMALPEATAGHLRLKYMYVDPASGTVRPSPLAPRGYRDVRATAEGAIAAHVPGLIAVGTPGSDREQVIDLDGATLLGFQWLPELGLVTVTSRSDGFVITSHTQHGARLLHQQDGMFLHCLEGRAPTVLAKSERGDHLLVSVADGSVQLTSLEERDVDAAPLRTVEVAPGIVGERRFALLHADNTVVVWHAGTGAIIARRRSRRHLPEDRLPVAVRSWEDGTCTRLPAPGLPPRAAAPPIRQTMDHFGTTVSLHRPPGPVSGTLVWLSHAGPRVPLPPDTAWLTDEGWAVLHVRLDLGWWPDTPDERIRPRVVQQIRDTVDACRPDLPGPSSGLTIGGASFGATLALMALADCELFIAGIAQSGAYSRHLTALGFQDEHRSLWEAPDLYRDFDAVVGAPAIRRPVLVIHGENDRNPATPLAQALLLFQALTANGTRARLVVLPGEKHTVCTREGLAAALAAKSQWLNTVGKEAVAHCT